MDQKSTLFIVLLLKGLEYSMAQYYLEIPRKLWAPKHSCVVIPCSYNYSNPKLSSGSIMGIWYYAINEHDRYQLFIKSRTPEKYASFIGDLGNGNCSIKIHNVQPENSQIYTFRVEMEHFKFSYKPVVQLNVLDDPPRPMLELPNQDISEGAIVTLNCSTTYTCSSDVVDLVWSPYMGQLNVTHSYQDEGVWSVESKQVFKISRKHDGMSVSCQAKYSSGVKSQVMKGKLTIKYKPEILQRPRCKKNLSTIYCDCVVIANPPAIITWNSTNINITETSGFFISFSSNNSKTVSRLEGAVMPTEGLWCTASNIEGSVSQNLPLDEKPQILRDSHCKKKLNAIYCECAAIANPPANITWSSSGIIVTETSGFSIHSSSSGSKTVSRLEGAVMPPGDLWCTASNIEGSIHQNLPIHVDWTELALIGGGILAFLILFIIGAVVAIIKVRSKKNQILEPNSYIMTDQKCSNNVSTKDRMMSHANRNIKDISGAISYKNSENTYANSVDQNEIDNYSKEETYVNMENEKREEEKKKNKENEEEDGIYINY
ncbi:sialic acid-binding Ig-like lectin 5 [Bufo gargarizans]|uniref:sialic acid-binding Ig-like lectin 5 n=1 Tax=Bufo gargarizans TaxID=30331 RepID=UPI001CF3B666|nr:sialic acid-binding Ig-like lectin 5 [Bufo gargarizans]XP_044142689.1 sialic acid-binding Ig-like lectin 5 [Bufo gargarizans]XP_044142697.1 sialic acid-binding Ig-like lectin 5 [Bufo gargarizans]